MRHCLVFRNCMQYGILGNMIGINYSFILCLGLNCNVIYKRLPMQLLFFVQTQEYLIANDELVQKILILTYRSMR